MLTESTYSWQTVLRNWDGGEQKKNQGTLGYRNHVQLMLQEAPEGTNADTQWGGGSGTTSEHIWLAEFRLYGPSLATRT